MPISASMASTRLKAGFARAVARDEADAAEQEFGVEVLALLHQEGDVLDQRRRQQARDLDAGAGRGEFGGGVVEQFERAIARFDAVGDGDAARFEQSLQAHGGGPGGVVHGDGQVARAGRRALMRP